MYPESVPRAARTTSSTRPPPARSRIRRLPPFVRAGAVGCLVGLALAACSGRPSAPAKPAPPAPEQRAAAQRAQDEKEAAARAAAEQQAQAKKGEEEATQRQQAENEKLPPEFGTSSVIGGQGEQAPESAGAPSASAAGAPGGAGAAAAAGGTPSGEGAAPAAPNVQTVAPVYVPQKLPPPQVEGATPYDQAFPPIADRVVRIGIVSGSSQAGSAQDVARMLTTEDRKYLEETLGLGIKIAYVSETARPETGRTRVYYRPQFFKAAVQIAALLPQSQQVIAMSDAEALRHGVDVLVQVGTDLQ